MNPAGFAVTVKAVTQLPLVCAFLDHQTRKTKFPSRKSRPHNSGSAARSQVTSQVKPVAAKWHPLRQANVASICSFNSVRFMDGSFCQDSSGLRQQILQRFWNVKAEHQHWHSRQKERQAATEGQLMVLFLRWNVRSSPQRLPLPARQKPFD